jgi:hypothetical protein
MPLDTSRFVKVHNYKCASRSLAADVGPPTSHNQLGFTISIKVTRIDEITAPEACVAEETVFADEAAPVWLKGTAQFDDVYNEMIRAERQYINGPGPTSQEIRIHSSHCNVKIYTIFIDIIHASQGTANREGTSCGEQPPIRIADSPTRIQPHSIMYGPISA